MMRKCAGLFSRKALRVRQITPRLVDEYQDVVVRHITSSSSKNVSLRARTFLDASQGGGSERAPESFGLLTLDTSGCFLRSRNLFEGVWNCDRGAGVCRLALRSKACAAQQI